MFQDGVSSSQQPIDIHWSGSPTEMNKALQAITHDLSAAKQAALARREITTMITHDLRSPLTALHATLEMLEEGAFGQLSPSGKQRMSNAKEITVRLMTMVDEMLDIERFQSNGLDLDVAIVGFQLLAEQSVRTVQAMADHRGIRLEITPSVECVHCDFARIGRVLVNLLSNAIKFSPRGTKICVSLRECLEFMEISVVDQGRGVPREMSATIFEKFQQTSRCEELKYGGSGLGLAICKTIVEAHGGSIGFESEEGKGSRFWFTLPKGFD
jgi:signal transduction histidine kinase